MGPGSAILLFFLQFYIFPALLVLGIFLLLYRKAGRGAAVAWLAVVFVAVGSFFSYFRFGFDGAIANRAIAEKNPALCNRLLQKPDPLPGFDARVRSPRIDCYLAYIQAHPTVETCARMPGWEGCIAAVALAAHDPSICSRYPQPSIAVFCKMDVHSANGTFGKSFLPECQALDPESRERCVELVALDIKDVALCKTLTQFHRFAECHDTLNNHASLKGVGAKMCAGIEDKASKEYCYYWFGINANEPKLCENIPDDGPQKEARDHCLAEARK